MRVFALFLALLFGLAHAGQPIYGRGPDRVFDTGPYVCPLAGLQSVWSPSTYGITTTIYIKRVQIWVGADKGFVGDIAHELFASNSDDHKIHISTAGWDHYTDVKSMAGEVHNIDWNGDYIRLEPWDTLTLKWSCSNAGGHGRAHWQVSIWYTLNP